MALILSNSSPSSGRFSFFDAFPECADIQTRLVLRTVANVLKRKLPPLEVREMVYRYLNRPETNVEDKIITHTEDEYEEHLELPIYRKVASLENSKSAVLWQDCLWLFSPAVVGRAVAEEALALWFRTHKPTFSCHISQLPNFESCGLWGHRLGRFVRKLEIEYPIYEAKEAISDSQFETFRERGGRHEKFDDMLELPKLLPGLTQVVLNIVVKTYPRDYYFLGFDDEDDEGDEIDYVELRYVSPIVFRLQENGVDARLTCDVPDERDYLYTDCHRDDWTFLFDPEKYNKKSYERLEDAFCFSPSQQVQFFPEERERLLVHYEEFKKQEERKAKLKEARERLAEAKVILSCVDTITERAPTMGKRQIEEVEDGEEVEEGKTAKKQRL